MTSGTVAPDPRQVENYPPDRLARLNTATKYPSIPTYHVIGPDRGRLTDERNADFSNRARDVRVTEKIDGTNVRIVIPPRGCGGAFIGSRDALIAYEYDVIHTPELGIVPTVLPLLDRVCDALTVADAFVVVFGEVYGHDVGKAGKVYTREGRTAFRAFDIAAVSPDVLDRDREWISGWRKRGGQHFADTGQLWTAAHSLDGDPLPLVPSLAVPPPPASVVETHEWLNDVIGSTQAGLDAGLGDRAEGVVVRTADRSQVAKIRFADYERTARLAPPVATDGAEQ